jgi:hypothetical protein
VPIVLKSGSLNLLEPSGPVKACNGIALPLPLPMFICRRRNYFRVFVRCTTGSVSTALKQNQQNLMIDGHNIQGHYWIEGRYLDLTTTGKTMIYKHNSFITIT